MNTNENELLEAALKLADIAKNRRTHNFTPEQISSAIDAVEKFRPAPVKPVAREWWLNVVPDGYATLYKSEHHARNCAGAKTETLHVREVLPDEPKPERWELGPDHSVYCGNKRLFSLDCGILAEKVVSEHNRAIGREDA